MYQSAVTAAESYTVQQGDSLQKISNKYQSGISELIAENLQIQNPPLIHPGQRIHIPQGNAMAKELEQQIVDLVNKERAKNGLKPLTANWELARVARYKSQEMNRKNYFSHTSPIYGSPFEMLQKFGVSYSAAGENIARGQRTAQSVMAAWLNSEGHRRNILDRNFTEIGVGYDDTNGTPYWTQMFIRP